MATQVPCGKHLGGCQSFSVTGRQKYHQPPNEPVVESLKLFDNLLVMFRYLKPFPLQRCIAAQILPRSFQYYLFRFHSASPSTELVEAIYLCTIRSAVSASRYKCKRLLTWLTSANSPRSLAANSRTRRTSPN